MKNLTGVTATTYYTGVEQVEAIHLVASPARRA